MQPRERIGIALRGGKPDRVPTMPIYSFGYIMNSMGRDPRERYTASAKEITEFIEQGFLRHPVDASFVHPGRNDEWIKTHLIEKSDAGWTLTNQETGETFHVTPDGASVPTGGMALDSVSKIQTWADLDAHAPACLSPAEIEASGRFWPVRHMARTYPQHHFSFQIGSPMVAALHACGGFVQGLVTMASDRALFRELLARCTEAQCAYMASGKEAGAESVWLTSYYTGADTIEILSNVVD